MNREIKFRAWDGEQMQYADANQYFSFFNFSGSIRWGLYDRNDEHRILSGEYAPPVMQFTGLQDKNGVDIYEGDVFRGSSDGIKFVVIFSNGCFCLRRNQRIWGTLNRFFEVAPTFNIDVEIIGNIHQNPELL
jgi:uncharacterized phage protein (TIGR01671 family)